MAVIREKISKLNAENPDLDYFQCKQIFEDLIKDPAQGAKNVFGQYTVQQTKDWNEVLKLFETNNIFLGDAASKMINAATYEM
jgi:ribonucleotide reductase beta subunit family protein with ferritin-like domain